MAKLIDWLKSRWGGRWTTLEKAKEIFPNRRIITMEEMIPNPKSRPLAAHVPYSENILKECATDSSFWLFFSTGASIARQTRRKLSPELLKWIKAQKERRDFVSRRVSPGYYLLKMEPLFLDMTWEKEERLIKDLGKPYIRANETVFCQAYLSILRLRGIRCFEKMHYGPTQMENPFVEIEKDISRRLGPSFREIKKALSDRSSPSSSRNNDGVGFKTTRKEVLKKVFDRGKFKLPAAKPKWHIALGFVNDALNLISLGTIPNDEEDAGLNGWNGGNKDVGVVLSVKQGF